MLYLIKRYGHGVSVPPSRYHFYWHSGGGAHHWFIVSENQLQYWEGTNPEPLPTSAPSFFNQLKKFIELDYREINNTIEVATPRPGKLIGRGGRNIKEIKKHLNKDIRVIQSWTVMYSSCSNYNSELQLPDKKKIELQPEEIEMLKPFHVITRNGKYAIGYLAPWKHWWLLNRTEKVREYVQKYSCGHIKDQWTKTINISKSVEPRVIEYTWDDLCPRCKEDAVKTAIRQGVRECFKKYGYEGLSAVKDFLRKEHGIDIFGWDINEIQQKFFLKLNPIFLFLFC